MKEFNFTLYFYNSFLRSTFLPHPLLDSSLNDSHDVSELRWDPCTQTKARSGANKKSSLMLKTGTDDTGAALMCAGG